jgi:phosphotriesterase-related protein
LKVLEKGVYISFDRFGMQGCWGAVMDSTRIAVLVELLGLGYANRILLSHDYVNYFLGRPNIWRGELKTQLAEWHYSHIFENILPELIKAGVSEEQINTMMVGNPRDFFSGE